MNVREIKIRGKAVPEMVDSQYSSEKNEISLTLHLKRDDYKARERLKKILNMMKKIESGDLNVAKRSEMIELANKENIDYYEEPTGETNYTFYF